METALPLLTLYTRDGCCLCDRAKDELMEIRREYDFLLEEIDIASDPELLERYGRCIPVLHLNGRLMFRGKINARWLKLRLKMFRSRPSVDA
ncbi:MAG: glutaredoxin family protein [Armatimonadetes bacterium]|nr:glutaredoxin family protein [Armatimonadota bacterium]